MDSLKTTFADSHCHLSAENFDNDRHEIIKSLQLNQIETIISVSDSTKVFPLLESIVNEYDFIYTTAGYHPHNAKDFTDNDLNIIKDFLKHPKVKAIGEVGLDFHYNFSDKAKQLDVFEILINLSLEEKLPLIIHNRNSTKEMIEILGHFKNKGISGVIHCFDSDIETAKIFLDMGFYISFSGIICFSKAYSLLEALKYVPIDRMLIETDSPYLAPPPMRGKRNEPKFVKYVAEKAAEIKNINIQEIAGETKKNTYKLFNI